MIPIGKVNEAYDALNLPRDAPFQAVRDRIDALRSRLSSAHDSSRLSAGEEAPLFYFDKFLNKSDYIYIHGWALGPRLPKESSKGAKYYYVINPDGEKNIVELTHWPLYLFRLFLEHIRSHY